MIPESLTCVCDELNDFFKARLKIADKKAVIAPLTNQDGSAFAAAENKLIISLINIERESLVTKTSPTDSSSFAARQPSINLNLYIVFAANFSGQNYTEGLSYLSLAISYLQQKPVFTRNDSQRLPDGIDKLIFEVQNVPFERLNNIWTTAGAKYMPSLVYKMRMLTFSSAWATEYTPAITGITDRKESKPGPRT